MVDENMEDHHGQTGHISTFGLSVGNSSPSFWNLILCRWRKRISSINYKLIIPNLMFKPYIFHDIVTRASITSFLCYGFCITSSNTTKHLFLLSKGFMLHKTSCISLSLSL